MMSPARFLTPCTLEQQWRCGIVVELKKEEVAIGSSVLMGVCASAGRLTTGCARGGELPGRHQMEMRAKKRRLNIPR